MTLFKCTIEGRPIVKKNTQRVIRRHGSTRVIYSPKFTQWQVLAMMAMTRAKAGQPMIDQPMTARFKFYFKNRQAEADLSNLLEGPQDVLKKAGVIQDDRLIHIIHATKHFGEEPRVEIELEAIA